MLISPLKTTSSALSCSTFMASSSWQASASWASCPGQRKTGKSASAWGGWGAGEGWGDSDAHLLQLSHSVLKLDTHCVLLFPSRETNALVRSHQPRLAGCRRGGSGSCSPQSYPRGGDDGTGVGRRTCPGMHRPFFPEDGSCQMLISSPPSSHELPHHGPHYPRHGLADSCLLHDGGSWGHQLQAPHSRCAARPATPGLIHGPDTAQPPLHPPLSLLAFGSH